MEKIRAKKEQKWLEKEQKIVQDNEEEGSWQSGTEEEEDAFLTKKKEQWDIEEETKDKVLISKKSMKTIKTEGV